jgi:hypothetical protein
VKVPGFEDDTKAALYVELYFLNTQCLLRTWRSVLLRIVYEISDVEWQGKCGV